MDNEENEKKDILIYRVYEEKFSLKGILETNGSVYDIYNALYFAINELIEFLTKNGEYFNLIKNEMNETKEEAE